MFLSPEDLLLHLSIHATTQHLLRNGLRMIYDVAASLSHYQNELDWDILLRRARQWKADRATYLMFCMANQFFGAPLPNGFLEELEPEEFNPEIMNVAKDLVIIKEKPFTSFSPKLAGLLAAKSPLAKIHHILRRIFIPPGEMAMIYPVKPGSLRLLLYYPVRVVDAVSKHYKSGLNLLRGEPATIESARVALTRAEQENWLVKALSDR